MRSEYFSVEFITDDDDQKKEILAHIQEKYPLAVRSEENPRISAWHVGSLDDYARLRKELEK
jgi:hypothetical protein